MDTFKEKTEELAKLSSCLDTLKRMSIGRNESEKYFMKSTELLLAEEALKLTSEIEQMLIVDVNSNNEYLEGVERELAENSTEFSSVETCLDGESNAPESSVSEESIYGTLTDNDLCESHIENTIVEEQGVEVAIEESIDNGQEVESINCEQSVDLDDNILAEVEQQQEAETDVEEISVDELPQSDVFAETMSEKQPFSQPLVDEKPKVKDLKQSLSIADRFRFQREIFGGSGERMSDALSKINAMETLDEAIKFADESLSFDRDNKTGQDFIAFLKRRF